MNAKVLIGVTAVLVAVAAALMLTEGQPSRSSQDDAQLTAGAELIEPEVLPKIDSMTLATAGDAEGEESVAGDGVVVSADGGRWTVAVAGADADEEAIPFPADGGKIARFLDTLDKLKVQRRVAEDDSLDAEVGLDAPTTIRLAQGDATVLELAVGDRHSSGGRYARVGGDPGVVLLDGHLSPQTDASSWELRKLVGVKEENVKTVTVSEPEQGDVALTLTRADQEAEWTLADLDETQESVKQSPAGRLARALSSLSFTKKHDVSNVAAQTALEKGRTVTYELFDGRTYTLTVGVFEEEDKKTGYLQINASAENAAIEPQEKETIALLNQLGERWAFEVSEYTANNFAKTRDAFVEEKQPESESEAEGTKAPPAPQSPAGQESEAPSAASSGEAASEG